MDNYNFSGVRKTYVRFSLAPCFCERSYVEDKVKQVKSRNLKKLEIPEFTFKFYFFDRIQGTVEIKGKKIGLQSQILNRSKTYYYGAKVYTREELQKTNMKRKKYFLKNMNSNPETRIVFFGQDLEFQELLDVNKHAYVFLEKPNKAS
jgi:hypothetical protein